MDGTLVARAHKVAYYGVPSQNGETVFHRMKGFTDFSTSKNSKEYTRQYVDELFEQTDVTGYSPSSSYGFDQYKGNPVHDDIVALTDGEKIGNDAIRTIILVNLSLVESLSAPAVSRSFSVVPDAEGGSLDAYTYTGNFKAKGGKVDGKATTKDDWQTIVFTAVGESVVPEGGN